MPDENITWMAEQFFQCRSPEGRTFAVAVRLGVPQAQPIDDKGHGANYFCNLSLDSLAQSRRIGGATSLQALCLALDHVRRVFKTFAAEGGRIYWGDDTNSPVDLDSPSFAPIGWGITEFGIKMNGD